MNSEIVTAYRPIALLLAGVDDAVYNDWISSEKSDSDNSDAGRVALQGPKPEQTDRDLEAAA
eukprot:1751018-Rhodomonas_salina.1